jgi:hypothetical protein
MKISGIFFSFFFRQWHIFYFSSQKVVVCLAIPQINKKICHICQLKMHTVKKKKSHFLSQSCLGNLEISSFSIPSLKIFEGIFLLFTTFSLPPLPIVTHGALLTTARQN